MTVKIKVHLSIGIAGAVHNDVIEIDIPDDATEEVVNQIKDEACEDWANNFIDLGWTDIQR
jgi:hypothetical protein